MVWKFGNTGHRFIGFDRVGYAHQIQTPSLGNNDSIIHCYVQSSFSLSMRYCNVTCSVIPCLRVYLSRRRYVLKEGVCVLPHDPALQSDTQRPAQ